MSSSSYSRDQAACHSGAAGLIERAFSVLEREAPVHAGVVADALGEMHLRVDIGDEAVWPAVVDGHLVVATPTLCAQPSVVVRTTLGTIRGLIDGECTLFESIRAGTLYVSGTREQLLVASDLARSFLHGLVRSRSATHLLRELRMQADRERDQGTGHA